jgi:hypothetical protein
MEYAVFTTVITFLTNRFGATVLPKITAVLFGLLGGLLLWFYFSNSHLASVNKKLDEQVVSLTQAKELAEANLTNYKNEVARTAAIDKAFVPAQNEVKIQKVEVIHEVIKYRDNPAVVHSSLSPQWVCTHDHSAALVSAIDITGGSPSSKSTAPSVECTTAQGYPSVTDTEALATVTENYGAYNDLLLRYNRLYAICSGYDPRHK